ncbi:MAG: beta-lactamase family protein [Firmicutes bacterium]|nr:beta-lactamase family protein [Bacillota bacterium]
MQQAKISGEVLAGFEDVKSAFYNNFTRRGEIGAACAIFYKGKKVVDLWGGKREGDLDWERDTMTLIFSATKGIATTVLAKLHSQGLLDYEERISAYWPEFGQNGKQDITVRQLLTHQAGLVLLDKKLSIAELNNFEHTAAIAARAKPCWEPGTHQGYQAGTVGFYMGELVRRIDPQKRSLGQFFQEEIARPLSLEFYIGLPDTIPAENIARINMINPLLAIFNIKKMPPGLRKAVLNFNSLFMKSATIIGGYNPNQRQTWRIEQPSGNGIGTARSVACLYSLLAQGGDKIGIRPETFAHLNVFPEKPAKGYLDMVMNFDTRYGLGFMKPDPIFSFSQNPRAFGFLGATGSFAFADPEKQIGYAYFTRKMGYYGVNDPREKCVREAMYHCINKFPVSTEENQPKQKN